VKIALIASVTSLLVALISLVIAMVSNRHSARSGKEIEKLKFDLSRATARDAISDAQQAESLKALQLAIQSIQRVKDEIQVILSAAESSLESKSAIEGIRSAREQMFACYEEQMATLDSEEARIVHQAKNISLQTEAFIKRSLSPKTDLISLSDEQQEQLLAFRTNLTELQGVLRDSRDARLMRRLGVADIAKPAQIANSESLKVIDNLPSRTSSSLEGLRLLVVDDQESMPQMVALAMKQYGVEIKGANSAVEALAVLTNWKPDVLVSDIMMPDEDGHWLIKQVRALKPKEGGLIPAIAITGGYDAQERKRLLSAGYNVCLPKPVHPPDIIKVIRSLQEELKRRSST